MPGLLPKRSHRRRAPGSSRRPPSVMHLGFRLFALLSILLLLEWLWSRFTSAEKIGAHVRVVYEQVTFPLSTEHSNHVEVSVSGSVPMPLQLPPATLTTASTSTSDPSPRPSSRTKAIVAAALKHDDVSWMHDFFPEWQRHIFVMDDPTASLTVAKNKGNEGSAYLTYIINNYKDLPDNIVFVHGPRYQWHNEDMMYDHVPVLKKLEMNYVDETGYASLRCTWEPGCPVNIRPGVNKDDGLFGYERSYAEAWETFWPGEPIPEKIGAPCCAQFAVSKIQVLQRSMEEYERIRQWLWETPLDGTKSGRIMEYMWHILFGQNPVACPTAEECFCKKFGLCDLDCQEEGACENRFWQPWPLAVLPKGWPKMGQGTEGWPIDRWWEKSWIPSQAPPPAPPPAQAGFMQAANDKPSGTW
ncbi:hypothetical protein FH972_022005 [Carpinus fangiana]|uniref:Uncharacterized protein n=1 Tax=Carpinus fangiana TaxID=176857 RepID=A0A5N6KRJ6_9ROSI|nr:hypothetical protein FH972_022005 [Carpinus fangiana]